MSLGQLVYLKLWKNLNALILYLAVVPQYMAMFRMA